jgi:hypothetical protein
MVRKACRFFIPFKPQHRELELSVVRYILRVG